MKNGRVSYMRGIRHSMALMCAHRAMAMWLCYRFTILKHQFPDPMNFSGTTPMIPYSALNFDTPGRMQWAIARILLNA